MKILLLDQIARVNYKYGFSLANTLKNCGNNIEMVIDDRDDPINCHCRYENKFITSKKDVGKIKKILNYCQAYSFIYKKMNKEDFDILHTQWFQFSPVDYYYIKKIKKSGKKIITTIHDILPFNEKFYDREFHRKIYCLSDQIIVQAENNLKRFTELFPNCIQKVTYIPHGHFLDYADIHDKFNSRKKLNVPHDKVILLFFGQIKKVKGVGVLLEAYGKLIQQGRKDIYLIIAGSMWKDEYEIYQDIIKKYNLNEDTLKFDIRYVPDEEVGYYYSACDIAILPYIDVYQSGVIQLAYAYSKPTIATNIGAFSEIVQDGISGFLCEPNDVNSLKNTIAKAIEYKALFDEMGEKGREFIRDKYSWEDIGIKVTALYNK